MSAVRVLLADDHAFLCEMLAGKLAEAGMEVVAKVHDAAAALVAFGRLGPDVAVLDIDMPGPSVFDVVHQLRAEAIATRIVLLSAHVTDHYVSHALDLGVQGYLRKTESLDVIVAAVGKVAAGETWFSAEVRERIAVAARGSAGDARSRLDTLTEREIEVLGYIARGLAKKEIAALMHRSVKTVDQHCTNLMAKLEIHDRVELARFAIREGVALP